jgi:8-oxo-dGTP diphosphatase
MAGSAPKKYQYDWPRPALTVDALVVSASSSSASLLLIKRDRAPFAGALALPGGFVDEGEKLVDAAARELAEETGLTVTAADLKQLGAFGDPGRDPRGWTVTVAYGAVLRREKDEDHPVVKGGDDAREAAWIDLTRPPPPLAFDHADVIGNGLRALAASEEEPLRGPLLRAADAFAAAPSAGGGSE